MMFGEIYGFIYNYIGLTIGSILSFIIARNLGMKVIYFLFKKDTVNKYLSFVKKKTFNKIFLIGILLPGTPDDLLCYIAGISKMSFKLFIIIIFTCKPLTLIFYSLFRNYFSIFN